MDRAALGSGMDRARGVNVTCGFSLVRNIESEDGSRTAPIYVNVMTGKYLILFSDGHYERGIDDLDAATRKAYDFVDKEEKV
jgi:hypothetical protein